MTRTTARGRDQITEEAADAAIEQACRILRLPTIRDRFGDQAAAAARQQATYKSFLSELLFIECEDREVRRKARLVKQAGSLARNASRTSTSPRTRTSRPHWSTPSPRAPGSAPGSRSA
jgi:hypothetical protein